MANTFLPAQGHNVGDGLYEPDLLDTARGIRRGGPRRRLRAAAADGRGLRHFAGRKRGRRGARGGRDGPGREDLRRRAAERATPARTAGRQRDGGLGVFEVPPFDAATVAAARCAGELSRAARLVVVAGGGDTVAALNHAGVAGELTFVSTAGGAFLEWMEGKLLPGVEALQVR